MRSSILALAASPLLVLAGLTATLSSCGSDTAANESATLVFTAIPDENATELMQRYARVAEHLSSELDINVEFKPVPDYGASVEAFTNGDVHLAWFGGLTGAKARARIEGAQAIAQGSIDPQFRTYFVANPASGLTPGGEGPFPMEFEGKSFTFGSDESTSGRLMPEHFIRSNTDRSPAEFFGADNRYSGSHDKTWEAVQNGTVNLGAMSYTTYDKRLAEGKIDAEQCFIAWISPAYPDYSWNAHPAIDEVFGAGTIDRLKATLTSIEDPELLEALGRPQGLIAAQNSDFDPLVELATQLELMR